MSKKNIERKRAERNNGRITRRQIRRGIHYLGVGVQLLAILFGDHNVSSQTKKQDRPPAKTSPGFISDIEFEDVKKPKQ